MKRANDGDYEWGEILLVNIDDDKLTYIESLRFIPQKGDHLTVSRGEDYEEYIVEDILHDVHTFDKIFVFVRKTSKRLCDLIDYIDDPYGFKTWDKDTDNHFDD